MLKLSDVHPHWRYKKPRRRYVEPGEFVDNDELLDDDTSAQNPLLQIQNPKKIKPKGRSRGASNKKKSKPAGRDYEAERQRAFDNSTLRESSGFDYAEAIDLTTEQVQVSNSQPSASQYTMVSRPPSQLHSLPSTVSGRGEFMGSADLTPRRVEVENEGGGLRAEAINVLGNEVLQLIQIAGLRVVVRSFQ